jgi:membrane-bound inhibitor of C-type lysozyme
MTRIALAAGFASLLFAGMAYAETTPTTPPGTAPKTDKQQPKTAQPATPPKTDKAAKPDTKTTAKAKKVTYACDGGVSLLVRYPTEAEAKTKKAVKVTIKDTTYNVRPVAGAPDKYENKSIKLVFETKGDEATFEREGKPLAEKCKQSKPGT